MWIDDEIMRRCAEPLALSIFVPNTSMVVMGSSNRAQVEVCEVECAADGIPILKRYGGGGTVLLYPGCVVISLGTWVKRPYENKHYFHLLNGAVIDALKSLGPAGDELGDLAQDGLSDIVFRGRKLAGTSLFRSRNYLLYQASLLVNLDLRAMDRYLRHPSKEPEYRRHRSHRDFLMGTQELLPKLDAAGISRELNARFPEFLTRRFAGELIEPQPPQFANLLRRVERQD